ncbi:hypothetical protein M1M40_gp46 [Halorubrum tailed virus 29]|uniref:Uncharacterized protein n=1 Tax=Halorubrum tailed virus 29 TaxID=2878010 RepID=A0AAE8Y038_9CAUD|nr:hypothetical protein M1M40_gp46 [Halorubrum tailed virus 29]UBF23324.1 hypothetical protein HRTV-29_gp46 [Halorubrum tailed virus 29]
MAGNRPTWSRSLIPDSDEEFVDNKYSAAELERMDGRELQSLAAAHPTDEVNGKSKADDIRDALEGKERVET